MFTITLLSVDLNDLLTEVEKKNLHIPQAHTPSQAILSGFWLFGVFFFLLFFPHYLWTACSRREPAYNCYLSRTVASCKRLKCHSLQLKLSRSVFSKEVCAQFGFFFLLWKIILFWLFTKILDGFYCYLGLFLMGILEILQNERKPKFLIHKSF